MLLASLAMMQPFAPTKLYAPADAISFALADIQRLNPEQQHAARYLWLGNLQPADRIKHWQTLSFLCNSLSRERIITQPTLLAENTLARIFLDDYRWSQEVWEELATKGSGPVPISDPYFHATLDEVITVFDHWEDGGYKPDGTVNWIRRDRAERKKGTFATGPWLPADAMTKLITLSGSSAPVLRADWFIANASYAPAYYNFLGLGKKQADFDELVHAIHDKAQDSELRAAVVRSGSRTGIKVSLHNRGILREPTLGSYAGGYKYTTQDYASSIDENNVLQNILGKGAKPFSEQIASLPNGLQGYFLLNDKGERIDFGAANVVQDSQTISQDKQVFAGIRCMTCHASGLHEYDDEVRHLARDKIALLVADKEDSRKIKDLFFSVDRAGLDALVKRDAGVYSAAVKACNGLTSELNAGQIERVVYHYLEAEMDMATVAREAGVMEASLIRCLQKSQGVPPEYTGLLQSPPRPLRRDQHERVFGVLMVLLGKNH